MGMVAPILHFQEHSLLSALVAALHQLEMVVAVARLLVCWW